MWLSNSLNFRIYHEKKIACGKKGIWKLSNDMQLLAIAINLIL